MFVMRLHRLKAQVSAHKRNHQNTLSPGISLTAASWIMYQSDKLAHPGLLSGTITSNNPSFCMSSQHKIPLPLPAAEQAIRIVKS